MACIPRRRGRFSESSSNSSSSRTPIRNRDGQTGLSIQLQLQNHHHRHTLDHSYFPEGNEDMNAATMFPSIPGADTNHADRIYADPYRENVFVVNRNGEEMYFTDEEKGLYSSSDPGFSGKLSNSSRLH